MSKKTIIAVAVATLAFAQVAKAQTNLQVFYDFGSDRKHITTTLEGFYADNWGNTFFFIDHDYNNRDANEKVYSPSGTYLEIARCLNFWQNTALKDLSLQVEYNGGIYNTFPINNAWLAGLDYFLHSDDYRYTFNIKALYKYINYAGADHDAFPMQFTFVWGMQDLFGLKGLRFSGFADIWGETHTLVLDTKGEVITPEKANFIFISEPQLWYNVGQHFGCPNLNIGGEVELSYNFGVVKGFKVRPCAGLKWVF